MKKFEDLNTEEKQMLINEFITTNQMNTTQENLPIELLKYLKEKNVKVEDPKDFQVLYDQIESKLF
ncbi:hypothetical protein RH915_08955 [Serpentinicella sp. ANB-PHB4]|uniref:hypothetical protein n=1 Tax=Serpentinicella sp. ANB-PHB4 TaxID=3074076 RepID=UPI00285C570A|nr:hypothetical protein [Serpentinicella sp. ANB-PHB4]MDR5659622.1 hypothetical protein [Serpentinicella sp. ANB-PHB4]